MVNVNSEVVIDCPFHQVVDFASNPDNAPKWYQNIHTVNWKTPRPLKIGSEIEFVAKIVGSDVSYVYTILELSENRLSMNTTEGPFPIETIYEWEMINEQSTLMRLTNIGSPSGVSKLIIPLYEMMIKKDNLKDLARLKALLESL